ncbi:conserved oligomeric Golgi complex subunit 1-like [Rhodnius prolixus]|uniref:conserved oligomeric Golgi complex subunit 1-like n=1 Tax=Rhodnius prolixus TaxID=13249 RepID=UPI003D18EF7D
MKVLSEEVIQDIDAMIVEMAVLQKKQQQPYKSNLYLKESTTTLSVSDSIAAQLSILIELPEMIWAAVTSKEYIRASQLFLFGRHIKTGFSVEKNLLEVAHRIPILDQQWTTILHFKEIILQTAEKELKVIDISPKVILIRVNLLLLIVKSQKILFLTNGSLFV